MKKKKYCFFHKVDLDGQCSGAIVKYFVPDVELMPFNYNNEFPWDLIKPEDTVYFVDVVLQPYELLLKLHDLIGDNLFIFDHHKSFLDSEPFKELKNKIPKNLSCDSRYAGCELTWKYFKNTPVPVAISLLGQYDSWRDTSDKQFEEDVSWDLNVLPFQFGMRLHKFDQEYFLKHLFNANQIADTMSDGKIVLQYQENQNNFVMKNSFEAKIKGWSCLCVNGGLRNSQVFSSKWDKTKYDFMVAFSMLKDSKWSWSFYTDRKDRDASELAKQFGGGGHKGASGCLSDALIFE